MRLYRTYGLIVTVPYVLLFFAFQAHLFLPATEKPSDLKEPIGRQHDNSRVVHMGAERMRMHERREDNVYDNTLDQAAVVYQQERPYFRLRVRTNQQRQHADNSNDVIKADAQRPEDTKYHHLDNKFDDKLNPPLQLQDRVTVRHGDISGTNHKQLPDSGSSRSALWWRNDAHNAALSTSTASLATTHTSLLNRSSRNTRNGVVIDRWRDTQSNRPGGTEQEKAHERNAVPGRLREDESIRPDSHFLAVPVVSAADSERYSGGKSRHDFNKSFSSSRTAAVSDSKRSAVAAPPALTNAAALTQARS